MERVRGMAVRAASSGINVMILGETGVGKEVLARLIHQLSPRADKPFLALNCAGLSQTLIESELFGHERGAFTGAVGAKIGLLESANGGTVFLDEIGEMPLTMQAKLLRVIEAREVLPVGALRSRAINVRFVSATNRDLEVALARGEFRSDLLFRLNVISLVVPPLRERVDEIPALIDTFMAQMCRESGRRVRAARRARGDELPARLLAGRATSASSRTCSSGRSCCATAPRSGRSTCRSRRCAAPPTRRPPSVRHPRPCLRIVGDLPPLDDPKKAAERQRMLDALATCNGNQTRAAELLGMPRRTFVYKLESYGIPRPQKGSHARQRLISASRRAHCNAALLRTEQLAAYRHAALLRLSKCCASAAARDRSLERPKESGFHEVLAGRHGVCCVREHHVRCAPAFRLRSRLDLASRIPGAARNRPPDVPLRPARNRCGRRPPPGTDEDFMWQLVEALSDLRGYARRLTGDASDAGDLVQETCRRALESRELFIAGSDMRAWLCCIVRNLYRDRLRRLSREVLVADYDQSPAWAPERRPSWALVSDDDLALALASLQPQYQQTYVLYAVGGQSYQEIARRLQVPSSTVGTRILRARLLLREFLSRRIEAQSSGAPAPAVSSEASR